MEPWSPQPSEVRNMRRSRLGHHEGLAKQAGGKEREAAQNSSKHFFKKRLPTESKAADNQTPLQEKADEVRVETEKQREPNTSSLASLSRDAASK